MHDDAPEISALYSPAPQAVHPDAPARLLNAPEAQTVQATDAAVRLLYDPVAHGAHVNPTVKKPVPHPEHTIDEDAPTVATLA